MMPILVPLTSRTVDFGSFPELIPSIFELFKLHATIGVVRLFINGIRPGVPSSNSWFPKD